MWFPSFLFRRPVFVRFLKPLFLSFSLWVCGSLRQKGVLFSAVFRSSFHGCASPLSFRCQRIGSRFFFFFFRPGGRNKNDLCMEGGAVLLRIRPKTAPMTPGPQPPPPTPQCFRSTPRGVPVMEVWPALCLAWFALFGNSTVLPRFAAVGFAVLDTAVAFQMRGACPVHCKEKETRA